MSNYKYGMYTKTIAKIKLSIKNGMLDDEVKEKYSINDGQLGFIHDKLLKGAYKKLHNHEKRLLTLEKKMVHCTSEGFGLGVVIEVLPKENNVEWGRVHFNGRKFPTLVNFTKMSFDLGDGVKGKVVRL